MKAVWQLYASLLPHLPSGASIECRTAVKRTACSSRPNVERRNPPPLEVRGAGDIADCAVVVRSSLKGRDRSRGGLGFFVGCQGAAERRRVKLERPQPPVAARTYELDVAGRDGARVVRRRNRCWGPLRVGVRRVSSSDVGRRGGACPGLGCQSSLRHAPGGGWLAWS